MEQAALGTVGFFGGKLTEGCKADGSQAGKVAAGDDRVDPVDNATERFGEG